MKFMKILVYEDQPNIAENWSKQIRLAFGDADVKTMKSEDFQMLLEVLNNRRSEWRNEGEDIGSTKLHQVDEAKVIIVDYDLLQYSTTADTTGARLAYLLRCFTKCGFIIVLNEHGANKFDLRLANPSGEFADINLGSDQIGNPGLWKAPFTGYRPWYWPVVPDAMDNFEQCVMDVQKYIEVPIIEFLGLNDVVDWMPQKVWDFITGEKSAEEVTFKDFVKTSHGGIDRKDSLTLKQMARVAAARICTLLNLIILPDQSLLVDAPHLVSRFPSLILDQRDDTDTLNRLCNPVEQKIDDLLIEGLRQHRFQKSHWLWRPVWYWPEINRDEEIEEVKSPWTIKDFNWVFCEDISRFVPIDFAQDFRALVSPPYVKRFVFNTKISGAEKYVAQINQGGPKDPTKVEYVPQAAFSM